ncbi:MAG: DUF6580 family putative transport protein [Patescibacteria group bacterium]
MTTRTKILISLVLITLGVICRLLPHAWNFTPIMAIALFAGVYLGRNYALILPVAAMLIGDLFIGFYDWKLMIIVYACFAIVGLAGVFIKKYKSASTILAASIIASVIFFLATNWAVWQFSPWYAKTWAGLLECYTLALPFFRNTLLGNVFYSGVLFGVYEMIMLWAKQGKAVKLKVGIIELDRE